MKSEFRRLPLICLSLSLLRLTTGKLRLSDLFIGEIVEMDNYSNFQIFRHITNSKVTSNFHTVFIVSFKFSHLSHKANKLASIVPMLVITGFPGLIKKIYAVNHKNGYWQGMYEWESLDYLEEYKRSFVFKVMNKRAIPETIKSIQYKNKSIDDFITEIVRNKYQAHKLPKI